MTKKAYLDQPVNRLWWTQPAGCKQHLLNPCLSAPLVRHLRRPLPWLVLGYMAAGNPHSWGVTYEGQECGESQSVALCLGKVYPLALVVLNYEVLCTLQQGHLKYFCHYFNCYSYFTYTLILRNNINVGWRPIIQEGLSRNKSQDEKDFRVKDLVILPCTCYTN